MSTDEPTPPPTPPAPPPPAESPAGDGAEAASPSWATPPGWAVPSPGAPAPDPGAPPTASYPPAAGTPTTPGYGTPTYGTPYGTPAYGAGYPAPMPIRTDDGAIWALVLGIAGYVVCPIVAHIAGWIVANKSLESIAAAGGALGGEGMARAGKWLSIIGLGLAALGIVATVIFFLVLAATAGVTAGVSGPG